METLRYSILSFHSVLQWQTAQDDLNLKSGKRLPEMSDARLKQHEVRIDIVLALPSQVNNWNWGQLP